MTSKYRLVMRSGPAAGKSFVLDEPELFIGRDLNNSIVINDPEVSRQHARLFLQGVSYVLEDLGSTNGTFVNGQRLMGPYTLRPGELVMLGENISLLFEVVQTGPNATVASSSRTPETVQAPPPFVPPAQPAASSFEEFPSSGSGSYSGQVPASPPMESEKKRKIPIWIIIVGLLLIIACSCIAFFVYVDSANMWCQWFGWVFDMFAPGSCP